MQLVPHFSLAECLNVYVCNTLQQQDNLQQQQCECGIVAELTWIKGVCSFGEVFNVAEAVLQEECCCARVAAAAGYVGHVALIRQFLVGKVQSDAVKGRTAHDDIQNCLYAHGRCWMKAL